MFPPPQNIHLDIRALSGICGSISIACWVVVFSPQIIENFRRGSAEGLSVVFIVVWLVGDVFNILGAVLQEVLPTMVCIAITGNYIGDNANSNADHLSSVLHTRRPRPSPAMLLVQRVHALRRSGNTERRRVQPQRLNVRRDNTTPPATRAARTPRT